jgi:hypothetical protein
MIERSVFLGEEDDVVHRGLQAIAGGLHNGRAFRQALAPD